MPTGGGHIEKKQTCGETFTRNLHKTLSIILRGILKAWHIRQFYGTADILHLRGLKPVFILLILSLN